MIIKIITTRQKMSAKTWYRRHRGERHIETIQKTTVYFLFVPVWVRARLVGGQI